MTWLLSEPEWVENMDYVPEISGVTYDRGLPLFDPAHFDGIFDSGDPAARKKILLEIYGLFREEAGSSVVSLYSTHGEMADEEMREIVHSIAGSAANMGMARLAGLCRGVEQAIIEGNSFEKEVCCSAVRAEYEAACAAFSENPLVR